MGRSRRERVVALTKTRKHMLGKDKKKDIVQELRDTIDKYEHVYVFSTENMRNALLKGLRGKWNDSRFYFGRKRIIQIALGRTVEEEYLENMHKMSNQLSGNVGLLLTNRPHDEVVSFFDDYCESEYARSGFEATDDFLIPKGPIDHFEPNQVPNLRLIGLPVELKKGVVTLDNDLQVCKPGEVLTPEKAKIIELMGTKMAKFRLQLRCHYQKDGSTFEQLSDPIDEEED